MSARSTLHALQVDGLAWSPWTVTVTVTATVTVTVTQLSRERGPWA